MTIEEAARLLGVTSRTIYNRLARGEMSRADLEPDRLAAQAQALTPAQAARLLGVSRTTIARWQQEQRLPLQLDRAALENDPPRPRQRGPKRSRWSSRYLTGRHTFRPLDPASEAGEQP